MRLKAREQCRGRLHHSASGPEAGQRTGRCWGTHPRPKAQERLQQQQDGAAPRCSEVVSIQAELCLHSVLQSVLFPEETLKVAVLPPEKGKGPILNISQPQSLTSRGCTKHTWGWESKPCSPEGSAQDDSLTGQQAIPQPSSLAAIPTTAVGGP